MRRSLNRRGIAAAFGQRGPGSFGHFESHMRLAPIAGREACRLAVPPSSWPVPGTVPDGPITAGGRGRRSERPLTALQALRRSRRTTFRCPMRAPASGETGFNQTPHMLTERKWFTGSLVRWCGEGGKQRSDEAFQAPFGQQSCSGVRLVRPGAQPAVTPRPNPPRGDDRSPRPYAPAGRRTCRTEAQAASAKAPRAGRGGAGRHRCPAG